jgi:hypothetical protein
MQRASLWKDVQRPPSQAQPACFERRSARNHFVDQGKARTRMSHDQEAQPGITVFREWACLPASRAGRAVHDLEETESADFRGGNPVPEAAPRLPVMPWTA